MAARRRPAKKKVEKRAKKAPRPKRQSSRPDSGVPVDAAAKLGMPLESVLLLMTALFLLAAILLIQYEKGLHYGEGMFANKYDASSEG